MSLSELLALPPPSEPSACGCCEGTGAETPVAVENRPGLSAIVYRVGTHARFKASLLAALSDASRPALSGLNTRDDDDFSIALLDAWATVADVLTFYQERFANESYLRTATERRSLLELARLIGYELRPGVAASTFLAFTLEDAPGAPGVATIPVGTKVQSVPGPEEKPQTFETTEPIEARAEWNALIPQQTELRLPTFGSLSTYLEGVTTGLRPGDPLLVLGEEREDGAGNERWEFRRVTAVEPDPEHNRTRVRWGEPLGSAVPRVNPPARGPRVYALRTRAALFGHNAPDWNALPVSLRIGERNPETNAFVASVYANQSGSWADAALSGDTIHLDTAYSQIVPNSWIVLASPEYAEVYRVRDVADETLSRFTITAKATRLTVSGENISEFSPRNATVYAQSEALPLTGAPIADPLSGDRIPLDRLVSGLEPKKILLVTGKRTRGRVAQVGGALTLVSADGRETRQVQPGEEVIVLAPPEPVAGSPDQRRWELRDATGFEGNATARGDKIAFIPAADEDESVSEAVEVKEVTTQGKERTVLTLSEPLDNLYDRTTVRILGNIAPATHGETTSEALGNGDGSQPYQKFTLRQAPLTYTSAPVPSGGVSTLAVRVNDVLWHEVPTLYGKGPRDRVFVSHRDDDGKTTVQFGDGKTGARLPTGQENVSTVYRKGIGREGQVDAGQLSLLMTRPLGVKGVTNPLPATGAQDPEERDDARENAPRTVLTLERIVSLRDYEDFARAFSGIAKALVAWTWNGHARGVHVTVAGTDGDAVLEDTELYNNLVAAILAAGDPRVPLVVVSYRPVPFRIAGTLTSDPDYLPENVLAEAETRLRSAFGFGARAFGQPVALSEVIAVLQEVPGVVSVDIDRLYRADETPKWRPHIAAAAPRPGDDASVAAAELLTLDTGPLEDLRIAP